MMKDKLKALLDSSFLRFALVGVVNTLVGSAIMFGLYNLAGVNYWLSSAANYGLTSVLSFFLNKHFTFRNTERSLSQVVRFALNIAVCYLLAYGMAQPFVQFLFRNQSQELRDNAAMLTGMVLFVVLNYTGQRLFAFSSGWRKALDSFLAPSPARRRARLWAVLALVAVLFFVLNCLTPLYADDFSYSFTFAVAENKYRIRSLLDVFQSQLSHYQVINGRAVCHTLAQIFLMLGKPVFNAVNAVSFTGLGLLLYYHAFGTVRNARPAALLAIYAALWLLTPAFGQSFLWVTGACNYLYGPLLTLLYLIPFRRQAEGGAAPGSAGTELLKALLYGLLGVLAGWTNENITVALAVMVCLYLLKQGLERKPLRPWMLSGLAGNLLGAGLLLLAPGEGARLEGYGGFGGLQTMLGRALDISVSALNYLWPALLLSILFIALYFKRNKGRLWPQRAGDLSVGLIYLAGLLASVYSMSAAPYFPERAWSGPVMLSIIMAGSFCKAAGGLKLPKGVRWGIAALCAAAFLATYLWGGRDLWQTAQAFSDREASIAAQKSAGLRDVTVQSVTGSARCNCYPPKGDLAASPEDWPNTALALYYEVDSVSRQAP